MNRTTRAVTLLLLAAVAELAFTVGFAGSAYARPACGSEPCPITTTKAPVVVKLGKRKSAGTQVVSHYTLHCYNQEAWESWDTRLGKISFFNQVHWCGVPYTKIYLSMTTGNAAHRLVAFWHAGSETWVDALANAKHTGIRAVATGDYTLTAPANPLVLEEIQAKLCLNVYANGYARITCHD